LLASQQFSLVSLYSLCTPFGVSRVVCSAHRRLLAPGPSDRFHCGCFIDGVSMAASRVNLILTPNYWCRARDWSTQFQYATILINGLCECQLI